MKIRSITCFVPTAGGPLDELARAGAFLAIVNLSDTPFDKRCEVLIQQPAGTLLPAAG